MESDQVAAIFSDAEGLYSEAIRELEGSRLRNAAEKAWGATRRATDALIPARTGQEPETTAMTTRGLHELASRDRDGLESLVGRYHTRASYLHGLCFYTGVCEPREEVERRIRETDQFIRDAQELASAE